MEYVIKYKQMNTKLTIVTPCSRQENLVKVFDSIQFDKIDKWIIVYDTKKKSFTKMFDNPQIVEDFCNSPGISGNAQRNYGASLVQDGLIYFLDDDNIVHPNFWNLTFQENNFYTFDQDRKSHILYGNKIALNNIDTAQFVVPKSMFVGWDINRYDADGIFIVEVNSKNKDKHVYINTNAAYYNYLRR